MDMLFNVFLGVYVLFLLWQCMFGCVVILFLVDVVLKCDVFVVWIVVFFVQLFVVDEVVCCYLVGELYDGFGVELIVVCFVFVNV